MEIHIVEKGIGKKDDKAITSTSNWLKVFSRHSINSGTMGVRKKKLNFLHLNFPLILMNTILNW